MAVMKTVEAILEAVYGGKEAAASRFDVVKSAPFNWRKWGHFPARIAIQISEDARQKGMDIPLADIPVMKKKRPGVSA
jgi:hypothetical protein